MSYDTKTVTELNEARSRQSANPITPTRTRTFDMDRVPFFKRRENEIIKFHLYFTVINNKLNSV